MAGNFKITSFAGVSLPTYDPSYDLLTDRLNAELIALPHGTYDPIGAQRARSTGGEIIVEATATGNTASALQTTLDGLRALRGQRGSLVMELADGTTRSRQARCLEIRTERIFRGGEHMHLYQPVRFVFGLLGAGWNGASNSDPTTIDTSPKSATITNDGNVDQADVTITVTAGSADITNVRIQNTTTDYECDLQYADTIVAGKSLVIDCGALSVENDGSDDYVNFSFGATHAVDDWMRLAPGNNSMTYTLTGGDINSVIAMTFYDLYA